LYKTVGYKEVVKPQNSNGYFTYYYKIIGEEGKAESEAGFKTTSYFIYVCLTKFCKKEINTTDLIKSPSQNSHQIFIIVILNIGNWYVTIIL